MSRSLTYAEMAEALKITPESANRLARRKRWQRAKGNDGRTRVAVPEEALVRLDSPPVSPTDSPMDSPPDKLIKALEAHVETLKRSSPPLKRGSTSRRTIWLRMIPHMPPA
jgi:hypothetical protein